MEEIIQGVLNDYMIPGFITLIGSFMVYGMGHGAAWLKSHSASAKVRGAIEWMHTLAYQAVQEQEQVAVRELKLNGNWDLEGQAKVKAKAREVVARHLGSGGLAAIQKRLGHKGKGGKEIVLGMIDSAIEAAVAGLKTPGMELNLAAPAPVSDADTKPIGS
jgi:hypothetical protein